MQAISRDIFDIFHSVPSRGNSVLRVGIIEMWIDGDFKNTDIDDLVESGDFEITIDGDFTIYKTTYCEKRNAYKTLFYYTIFWGEDISETSHNKIANIIKNKAPQHFINNYYITP